MSMRSNRRRFLQASATGGAVLGLGDLGFLSRLRPVSADEASLDPKVVRLQPEIEPLVRLLEDTPRERLLEAVAARIKKGHELSRGARGAAAGRGAQRPAAAQRRVQVPRGARGQLGAPGQPRLARHRPLAADLLGARPLQGLAGPRRPRGELDDGPGRRVGRPAARRKARAAFIAAMDNWDEAAADAAVAGLARTAGANEIYELFFRYGARDFRSIGHKAIYVANSWRTLNCIGWQHAEPVLRSLAYALLNHEGAATRPSATTPPTGPGGATRSGPTRIKEGWLEGKPDAVGLGRPARDARARARTTTPASRSSSCSTAASRRSRSGTPCSTAPASCCSASRGSSRCTR